MQRGILIITLFLVGASGWAVDIHDDAGTTGAAFLKIDGGSRPSGMGGAFVGPAGVAPHAEGTRLDRHESGLGGRGQWVSSQVVQSWGRKQTFSAWRVRSSSTPSA